MQMRLCVIKYAQTFILNKTKKTYLDVVRIKMFISLCDSQEKDFLQRVYWKSLFIVLFKKITIYCLKINFRIKSKSSQ